jgi:hypothetical protein
VDLRLVAPLAQGVGVGLQVCELPASRFEAVEDAVQVDRVGFLGVGVELLPKCLELGYQAAVALVVTLLS